MSAPVIRKFLDLSTAHLQPADKEWLDNTAGTGTDSETAFGWWVWAAQADNTRDDDETLTEHLKALFGYARSLGCDYILFDADAEQCDDLPIFDEETGEEIVETDDDIVRVAPCRAQ